MPVTINVGYSEKLGQPDFGSIGASCHIECELDGRLVFESPDAFQEKVRELYAACSNAAKEELGRQRTRSEVSSIPRNGSPKSGGAVPGATGKPSPNGGAASHRASKRQMDFLEQLARQIPQVGIRRLESLAQRVCNKPIAELSSFDASSLIDTLKAIKEGKRDAEAALSGERR
ncbi:MAG TPA: hypothetical protein VG055_18855 [Planctomycetaceae bacterium]|jgi:hypothetical protein|nr:hypothetical protein [Planctomycetaceae bacterium]